MREKGFVLTYRVDRGFGFIRSAANQSLFFHIRNVRDGYLLSAGDPVSFEIRQSTKMPGHPECFNVEFIEPAPKAVQQ